jgi:tRNA-Thr(GGU) m(6)t(6)A37 methyltransferase TsaA
LASLVLYYFNYFYIRYAYQCIGINEKGRGFNMENIENIILKPVGRVISSVEDPMEMPHGGLNAIVEVFPQYQDALLHIEKNSHIWVLAWFHKAPRNILRTRPFRVNQDLPEYGVFALRAFARPNPIAMSLAKLNKIENNYLYVEGLDAVGGTPVLDIKPYFERDTIFSPKTPYIKGSDREKREANLKKLALAHHQEDCPQLTLAVKMASVAEDHFGLLNSNDLNVKVTGSPCLGDCIQGISRARLSNPPRFTFIPSTEKSETVWTRAEQVLTINLKGAYNEKEFSSLADEELFFIKMIP